MHLAALPPIYVSGTSRTNFGNNRTGSDRMGTGCPPGILDTVLPLQPETLPAEPIPTRFCHSFSLYSSAKACHPLSPLPSIFHLLSPFVFFFPLLFSPSLLLLFSVYRRESRESGHIVRNIVQFSYFIGPRVIKFNCRQRREITSRLDDKR